jgi:CrcB protein
MADGWRDYAVVALGSAIGGCARHGIGGAVARRFGTAFPWGTFVVNVTGCFVIALFLTLAADRAGLDARWRLFVAVGVCGGYTTFSALAWETSKLVEGRDWALAAANVAGSAFAGLAAVWLGCVLARRFG